MRVLARLCATFIVLLASRFARAGFTSDNEQGWTIHLDDDLVAKDPELARKVRSELHERLREIEDLLPAHRVQELRNIEIFVHAASTKASAEYALDNERVANAPSRDEANRVGGDDDRWLDSLRSDLAAGADEPAIGEHSRGISTPRRSP